MSESLNRKDRRQLQRLEAKQHRALEEVRLAKKRITRKILWVVGCLIVIVLGSWLYLSLRGDPHEYDALAKCLSEKNIVMYGAYWCPHCQEQKEMFRDSWEFISYVECASPGDPYQMTAQCKAAGVQGYPTWVFPGDVKLSGSQPLDKLAKISGCALK